MSTIQYGRFHPVMLMLICLIGFGFMVTSPSAQASSAAGLLIDSAYWEDVSSQASLQEAQSQALTPYNGIFNRGYSRSAHWLRLRVAASEEPISLRLSPPWIDNIRVHDSSLTDEVLQAGDRQAVSQQVRSFLGYSMLLPASPKPRELWLRLESTSTHRLVTEFLPQSALLAAETRALAWTAIYAAVLLLTLLALISIWWIQRERVLGTYLIRHTLYIGYSLTFLGLPQLLLPEGLVPPALMDTVFSFLVVCTLPIGLLFDVVLLQGYRPRPAMLDVLKLVFVASLLAPFVLLAGHAALALQLNAMGLMLSTVLVFAAALTCQPAADVEHLMPKKFMLTYYFLVLGSLMIGMLGVVGIKQPQFWSQYLLILHGLVSGLAMTMILFVRGQRQQRQHQEMRWQLEKARQDMVLEQKRRQEQSQFLHMLMHELKTPLSVLSLALGSRQHWQENLQHANHAVKDMKAIIERCVESDQLGEVKLNRKNEAIDVFLMVKQIAQAIPNLTDRLQVEVSPSLHLAQTDRQLLQIVLANLLTNANGYSDPVTPVQVKLVAAINQGQSGLEVSVSNTPGLAGWPDAKRLFNKYYRAIGAQRESGVGLGLYLSRQLTQSLGGHLDYRPDEKQVKFVLWIPLNFA